jgi:hypothetical protein
MTRPRSPLLRAAAATAVAAACFGVLPMAAWAGEAGSELRLSLRLANAGQRPSFLGDLQYNCNLFFSARQVPQGRSRWVYASMRRPALGTLDFGRGSGEVRGRNAEWQVEALPPSDARPTLFADLGIALQGRRAFLTARVTRGRPLLAGSRRVRLAVIRGAKFDIGPLIDRRDQQVPNTFSGAITGRLTMLSAMSRALERTRCKDRRRNRLSRRLQPGYVLGRFTAEVRPDRATGLAGNAQLRPTALDPVTARPAAGSTLDGQGIIVAPIAAGSPVPLACVLGDHCIPSGGTFALGGGFELVLGDRRVLVSNLVTATTGTPPAALRQTVSGTLDGVPVTVADGDGSSEPLPMTADFLQRAGAALGTELSGFLAVAPAFTRTGP